MKKLIPDPTSEQSISVCISNTGECYLVYETNDGDFFHGEIMSADTYLGGEDDGTFTNDYNYNFQNEINAEAYYARTYKRVWAFEDQLDQELFWEDNIELHW